MAFKIYYLYNGLGFSEIIILYNILIFVGGPM